MKTTIILALITFSSLLVLLIIPPTRRTHSRKHRISTARLLFGAFLLGVQEALTLPARMWARFKYRKMTLRYGANIAEGTYACSKSYLTSAAITVRHRLYKAGADDSHIAVCTASDVPIGVVADEATAAEQYVSVDLLGKGSTKRMVAAGALTRGDILYAAADGEVNSSGTYVVGVALTTVTTQGDIVEVADTVTGAVSAGVAASLFDAHTILYATTDNTPAALTVGASTVVGRKATGNISAMSGAETRTVMTGTTNINATPVAAAGSTVADAGQLAAAAVVLVTSDGAAKGVKLPTGVAGMVIEVINTTSTAAELYAASGGTVNGLSADASVVLTASTGARCICTAADTWLAFELTALATAS